MKTAFAKNQLLKIFELYPDKEIDSDFIFQMSKYHALRIVPAFNTHLSQLCESWRIKRVKRGTYILIP